MEETDMISPNVAGLSNVDSSAINAHSVPSAKPERRRELDMIGPFIVIGLVLAHTLTIFSGRDIIVNESQSEVTTSVAGIFISFAVLWAMPLMMLIAGTTIWYSLRKRTVAEFTKERFKRLFVPFVTGLVLAIPPMVYFKAKQDFAYAEGFLTFYPRFWQVKFSLSAFPLFLESATPDLPFFITHLWFLLYLLVYTLLLLPLLLYLHRSAGRDVVKRLANIFTRPWAIFLLALPIAVIEAILTTEWPGGWNRFVWPFFIIYGFVIASESRFGQTLVQHRRRALILGIICFFLYLGGMGFINTTQADFWSDLGLASIIVRFIKGLASWFWLVALMGYLTPRTQHDKANPKLEVPASTRTQSAVSPTMTAKAPTSSLFGRTIAYIGNGQVPLYVIHKTPIIVLGYYVVQWDVNVLVKFAVIALSSLLVTFLVYEVGIRRTAVTRFLFGMKAR
jgi:hypothetical protein